MISNEELLSFCTYRQGKFYKSNGKSIGWSDGKYRYINIRGSVYPEHRLVWLWFYGEWVKGLDHINGNKQDNRIENLRIASTQQNAFNRPRQTNSRSPYKGVYWEPGRNKWATRIGLHNACVAIGRYDTALEAALAYDRAIWEWAGDFATLNFEV